MFDFLEKLFGRAKPAGFYTNTVEIDAGSEWLKIVPVGYFPNHHDGAHQIEKKHIDEMKKNFDASSVDLLFDYEHRSLCGNSLAAGWGKELEAREDGLYVKAPEWTARAQEMIAAKEYRYLSPVYRLTTKNKLGVEIGATLVSVGLTNTPYFDNEIDGITNSVESEDMKFTKEFLARLGLPEDATAEQVEEKVNSLFTAQPVGSGEEAALKERIVRLEEEQQLAAAEAMVNSAIDAGKILPAEKQVWINSAMTDPTATKAVLEAKPRANAMPVRMQQPGEVKANKFGAAAEYVRGRMN